MRKTYYTDYVRHCLKFYSRYPKKRVFDTEAERNDYLSAHTALDVFPTYRPMLIEIYGDRDTLEDNVYNASQTYRMVQNDIWHLMSKIELKVAKVRGLK